MGPRGGGGGGDEAWLLALEKENQCLATRVLIGSLRHYRTSRKIVVLVGAEIGREERLRFASLADVVLQIGGGGAEEWMKGNWLVAAKIHAFSLTFLSKCCFLPANSMVLNNCDDLFEHGPGSGSGLGGKQNSTLLLQPSTHVYEELMELMRKTFKSNGISMESALAKFLTENCQAKTLPIQYSYHANLHKNDKKLQDDWDFVQPLIVHIEPPGPPEQAEMPKMNHLLPFQNDVKELWRMHSQQGLEASISSTGALKGNEPIAIVGMSGRFPGANNVEEFWQLLLNGVDATGPVPAGRWTSEESCTASPTRSKVNAGFLKCSINQFDARLFAINGEEANSIDPQHRLLLEVVWEALEDGAINPLHLHNTNTAVFTGIWKGDYEQMVRNNKFVESRSYRMYMGTSYGQSSARIAHFLGTYGPNSCSEAACSASMVAVGQGVKALRQGETNLALVGGVNLIPKEFTYNEFKGLLSTDGHSRTFDASANGFARAEGVGALVLKRLSDAVREGDRIHALIRGYGMCQEGPSKSAGTPTVQCESMAMDLALADGGVNPGDVSFIEAHGTGTPVGDPLEISAIEKSYGRVERRTPLALGAVKANIGHTESCSGITGIIKTVLALKHELIPPHPSLSTLHPKINLEKLGAIIPVQALSWPREEGRPRRAGVSSFGITGTDSHVILEEAPTLPSSKHGLSPDDLHIVTISAKSSDALSALTTKYSQLLTETPDSSLPSISFTANSGRANLAHRLFTIGKTCMEVYEKLERGAYERGEAMSSEKPKLCFLFTGQGSQYHGMGQLLYQQQPVFKHYFDKCDEILSSLYGIRIADPLWGDDKNQLHASLFSQTSIFVIEFCLAKLWESWGIRPDYVLGHSLGEFAAAVSSGMLSLQDALKLVGTRSILISKLKAGKMLVIKANLSRTEALINGFCKNHEESWIDIAATNSSDQTTVAGDESSISLFSEYCVQGDVKTHLLDATHAFHSRHMDSMLDEYNLVANTIEFSPPIIPYVSAVEGKVVDRVNADYWLKHTRERVKFQEAVEDFERQIGCVHFLEVGPHPVLSALVSKIMDKQPAVSCIPSMRRNTHEWETLLESVGKLYLQGIDINWKAFYKYASKIVADIPFYQFQRSKYWFDVDELNRVDYSHPLLGSCLRNPTEEHIFQNFIIPESDSFLFDHRVGRHVLLPASGYLEMCLAAGYFTLYPKGDSTFDSPAHLRSFTIRKPLEIRESEMLEFQTVCGKGREDPSSIEVAIFSRKGKSTDWVKHAEGVFETSLGEDTLLNGKREVSLEQIKLGTPTQLQGDLYKRLASVGYNFGDAFQSLKKCWTNERSEVLAQISIEGREGDPYFVHPLLVDAMIQTFLMSKVEDGLESLLLPVSVEQFVAFRSTSHVRDCYSHAIDEGDKKSVYLYDESGQLLAYMTSVQFVETTIERVERALMSEHLTPPPMFKEEWKQVGHALITELPEFLRVLKPAIQAEADSSALDQKKSDSLRRLNESVGYIALKALIELGWQNGTSTQVNFEALLKELHVKEEFRLYLRRLLLMLKEDGFLDYSFSCGGKGEELELVKVLRQFPSADELNRAIYANYFSRYGLEWEWEALLIWNEKLSNFLAGGNESIQKVLYPDEATDFSAETLLTRSEGLVEVSEALGNSLDLAFASLSQVLKKDEHLRVLEVGAGKGSATTAIALAALQKHGLKFKYTFTSSDGEKLDKAKENFPGLEEMMEFKKLVISKDPKKQGFAPHSFDIIISSNELHRTPNLANSANNVIHLLNRGGLLFAVETFKPQRLMDLVFGWSRDYFDVKDVELRSEHSVASSSVLEELLRKAQLESICSVEVQFGNYGILFAQAPGTCSLQYIPQGEGSTSSHWLIFGGHSELAVDLCEQIRLSGKETLSVVPGSQFKCKGNEIELSADSKEDMAHLFQYLKESGKQLEGVIYLWSAGLDLGTAQLTKSFLHLLQSLIATSFSPAPNVYLVTEGQVYLGDQEPVEPAASPLLGLFRTFRTENPFVNCVSIDLDPGRHGSCTQLKTSSILSELWKTDNEALVAYRSGRRHVARLNSSTFNLKYSPLEIPKTQKFQLIFPESNMFGDLRFGILPKRELAPNEIEVKVEAAGLNFRDIFSVLKPSKDFEHINSIGNDFAGVITAVGGEVKKRKVGEAVVGLRSTNCGLPSHVALSEDAVIPLPANMTFAEAATLPTVFATAYWCLIKVAKLSRGEWVLIHTASGGVGLCAIQIAKAVGARIVATAGSRRKRAYLQSLELEHVFSSRDLTFGDGIRRVTMGKGVDVVLNSLTGPGFKETSLSSCNEGARFVEMSKLNIWKPEDVSSLRADVSYSVEDLSVISCEELMQLLSESMNNNTIQALPYTRFDAVNVRDALTYLEKAKHVGKVVCAMPRENNSLASPFNDRSTYLITGGLRGIGLEIAKWMAENGAKYLVICGRSEPSRDCLETVSTLGSEGVHLSIQQADIGSRDECYRLLERIKALSLPPLRGIMHGAGCLADAIIPNQTWEAFETTFRPKVDGTWNLHSLTKGYNLEHFVLISSCVALVGAPGQCNHAAANAFLDSFAHYRNSLGLVATSINWGQWGEVGIAVGRKLVGFTPMPTANALLALNKILVSHEVQGAVIDGDTQMWKNVFGWAKEYLEELQAVSKAVPEGNFFLDSERFWDDMEKSVGYEERYQTVASHLTPLVASILKLSPNEKLDKNQDFQDLGMDSFMSIELRNRIQKLFGKNAGLTTAQLLDARNLDTLTKLVLQAIDGGVESVSVEDQLALAREDCQLWDHIKVVGPPTKLSEVEVVLLTGVTGSLGPYVLEQLTSRSGIRKIYCLVRGSKSESLEQRLESHLSQLKLTKRIDLSKVELIEGNVIHEFLGMGKEKYSSLAEDVEAVFHCAVCSNHLAKYRKEELKYSGIRAVNVIGTQRILEFSAHLRTKWVYQASSLLAAWTLDEKWVAEDFRDVFEEFRPIECLNEGVDFGYAISKFVSDHLDGIAVKARGLPVKVFSFPKIMGESGTGRQVVGKNHFFVKFLEYFVTGTLPDLEIPLQLINVDICASLSVRLFFMEEAEPGFYGMYNPHARSEKELASLIEEYGFELKLAQGVGKAYAKEGEGAGRRKVLELSNGNSEINHLLTEYLDGVGLKEFSILGDKRIRDWVKVEHGFSARLVPYSEFKSNIASSGERSLLSNWAEFYTSEDSLFVLGYQKAMSNRRYLNFIQNMQEYLDRNVKISRLVPELKEIILDPLETLKADFRFVIQNATNTFGQL